MTLSSIISLQERAKELQCLYDIEKILNIEAVSFDKVFDGVIKAIPGGWQFPQLCYAIIEYENKRFVLYNRGLSEWFQASEIIVDNNIVGKITVCYSDRPAGRDCFLPEEYKLLNTISGRLSQFIFYDKLKRTIDLLSQEALNYKEDQYLKPFSDEHWKWRLRMVQNIADKTDFSYYGLKAMYIIGSTKEAKAGPGSDIDLLVHFIGTEEQKNLFKAWIDGWNHSLSEFNRQKTGYSLKEGIIDLHIISDKDIEQKNSFAVMIGNANNPARLLKKLE
jgi:predicted nucleotidyltransferase